MNKLYKGTSFFFAGILAISTAASAADESRAWPLAVRIHSYGDYQDAGWKHLQDIGVKHIFLSVPEQAEVEATLRKLERHALKAVVLRGSAEVSKAIFVEDITQQLGTCKKMGVRYMFLSAKRNGVPKAVIYERLRAAGDAAKRYGVIIALETHPDLGTNGDVQKETMRAVDHPNVRVNFDSGNITYYNKKTSAPDELGKSIRYVATVEFKDHSGAFETWEFPVPGKGSVDFPALVKLLQKHGYAGPVTIEFEGVQGKDLTEEETKQAIAESVAYVRKLGDFK